MGLRHLTVNDLTFFNGPVPANLKVWAGQSTTASGVASFFPTDDGTGTGNALFTTIYSLQATAERDTAIDQDVALASIKAIAVDKKSITCNVVTGTAVLIGGDTMDFAPDGTNCHLTIFGV